MHDRIDFLVWSSMHNPKVFDGLVGRATYALDPDRPLETGHLAST